MQERISELLRTRDSVTVSFVDHSGNLRTEEARVGVLPLVVVFKRTWLLYLVVGFALGSAVSVFRRHHSSAGTVLAFFLLACALYITAAAPVVGRSLSLTPPAFKFLIATLHTAASGMITLAHFALVFPEPTQTLRRHPWILYPIYGSSLLATVLYLSGVTAFGTAFPLLSGWVLVIVGIFLHSLLQAHDPFLRKQIWLSLVSPALVSLFLICVVILPGVLRLPPVDFRYFAVLFLILPLGLPLALDNLALYQVRLEAEHTAQQEKEHLRADLHDLMLNNLAVISRASEVAQTQLPQKAEVVGQRLRGIQDVALRTSRQLREFLWVLDDRHGSWDALSSQLRQWGQELPEDTGCEFELEVTPAVIALPPPLRMRVGLDRVYKEVLLNVVKHARATEAF